MGLSFRPGKRFKWGMIIAVGILAVVAVWPDWEYRVKKPEFESAAMELGLSTVYGGTSDERPLYVFHDRWYNRGEAEEYLEFVRNSGIGDGVTYTVQDLPFKDGTALIWSNTLSPTRKPEDPDEWAFYFRWKNQIIGLWLDETGSTNAFFRKLEERGTTPEEVLLDAAKDLWILLEEGEVCGRKYRPLAETFWKSRIRERIRPAEESLEKMF